MDAFSNVSAQTVQNLPVESFGGKDRVKGNRQGSLSRSIKQVFRTFSKFGKPHERVKKILFDTLNGRIF